MVEARDALGRPAAVAAVARVFDDAPDAVLLLDDAGRVVAWNPAAAALFGHAEREALGMDASALFPPSEAAGFGGLGWGRPVEGARLAEVPAVRRDGARFCVDLSVSPLQLEGRRYVLCVARDASGRVRERTQAERELRQMRETVDALEAFASVVGHDLKEPVRAVDAYLQELVDDPDAPDRRELAQRAATAHRNLRRLLEGLLEWSRAARVPLEPRTLRIHEVLRDPGCAAQWDNLLRERGARLDVSADVPPVLATESLLCRVFGNLITNALRHNPRPAPRVRVRPGDAAPGDNVVEVVVEDDGPGFPADVLQRQDAPPSTLKGGFGLLITRRAVERLGGSMRLANRPEGGGLVRLRLPAPPRPPLRATTLEERVRELV